MSDTPLATPEDVQTLLSLLPPSQQVDVTDDQLTKLIGLASEQLRQRARWVDERIALYTTDPSSIRALSPALVASVVANIVQRVVINPMGVASKTEQETLGPYSTSETNSWVNARTTSDSTVRGQIYVTDADLAALAVPSTSLKIGTIGVGGRFV